VSESLEQSIALPRRRHSVPVLVRDIASAIAIALLLGCVIELGVRILAPQTLRTHFVNDRSLGLADAALGHVNQPDALARVTGPEFSVEYRINSQGFRDAALYTPSTAAGTTRILLLGDSFTQGAGSQYAQIWPVLAERKLRDAGYNVEIIKAGVFGYDTRLEALYLERLYERYRPDIVVIGFVFHDLFTNTAIGSKKPASATNSVASKKSQLHSIILARRLLMENDRLYRHLYWVSGREAWFVKTPMEQVQRQVGVTRTLFQRASRFCQQRGCELLTLSFPQLYQVIEQAKPSGTDIDVNWVDREFARIARADGFAWAPLLPGLADAYRRDGDDLYHRFDGHLNAKGNAVVADKAAEILAQAIDARESAE
jgi:lysophospholipase L1-like esterase